MTQTAGPTSPGSTPPLAQAWDQLIAWLSNAPASVQAQAMTNPQAALGQFGLGGVPAPQLQSAITNSPSFDRSHTVNQGGSGNANVCDPTPRPGESPADAVDRVFNYHISNNYSQIVDNSINVAGDFTGDIDQKNVVGDNNSFGDDFDIDGDMNGQIVTGDHSNAAGGDIDDSVMGAGAVRMGDGNSFGNGTNFGSGTSDYTDNRGATIDNSTDNSFTDNSSTDYSIDNSFTDNSSFEDHSTYEDNSDHSSDVDTGGGDYEGGGNTVTGNDNEVN
jgi:hypothetical protein